MIIAKHQHRRDRAEQGNPSREQTREYTTCEFYHTVNCPEGHASVFCLDFPDACKYRNKLLEKLR